MRTHTHTHTHTHTLTHTHTQTRTGSGIKRVCSTGSSHHSRNKEGQHLSPGSRALSRSASSGNQPHLDSILRGGNYLKEEASLGAGHTSPHPHMHSTKPPLPHESGMLGGLGGMHTIPFYGQFRFLPMCVCVGGWVCVCGFVFRAGDQACTRVHGCVALCSAKIKQVLARCGCVSVCVCVCVCFGGCVLWRPRLRFCVWMLENRSVSVCVCVCVCSGCPNQQAHNFLSCGWYLQLLHGRGAIGECTAHIHCYAP